MEMHFYCKKKVKKIKTEITTIHRFKDKIVNQITIQKKESYGTWVAWVAHHYH